MKKKLLLAILISCLNYSYSADIIYNTPGSISTISSTLNVTDNLIVKSGTFLKITGIVYLNSNSKIVVEPGAVVRLQGGTLTSVTDDMSTLWLGVEVRGNGNYPTNASSFAVESYFLSNYTSLNSGVFYSINGSSSNPQIKYSKLGLVSSEIVSSWPSSASNGGYIECWYTTFYTNTHSSINITKSSGNTPIGSTCIVAYCTFNSAMTSSIANLDQHAQIYNKGGNLRVFGSSFIASNYSYNYIVGIKSVAAKTAIFNNTFTNYKAAIYILQENNSGNNFNYSFIDQNTITHKGNTTFYAINIDNSDLINIRSNKIYFSANSTG